MSRKTWFPYIMIQQLIDIFLHLDKNLVALVGTYGFLIYPILFMIILCETGLVIAPFLPGDSLIFAAGALANQGFLNIWLLFVLLIAAAVIGDSLNYAIGSYLGPRVFKEESRYFKKTYLLRTQKFYEKYGNMTIFLARFVPILRTFAPFVAGIGAMRYRKFIVYNISGGVIWVSLFLLLGYFFGGLPFVKDNFSLMIILIIVLSLVPMFVEMIRHRKK